MFFLNPKWDEIYQGLLNGNSAMVHCPRHYGKNFFYKYLANNDKINAIYNIVFLNLDSDEAGINHEALFNIIKAQANSTRVLSANNKAGFIDGVTAVIADKICLFIFRVTSENVGNSFSLINSFHNEMQNSPNFFAKNLTILILDDYSLYYHKFNGSLWDYIHRHWCGRLVDELYVQQNLKDILPIKASHDKFLEPIIKLTGGHEGLITESLLFLKNHNDITARSWKRVLKEHLETCDIIESIGRACNGKPATFFRTLHDYYTKGFTDNTNADVHEAHKIGVILKMKGVHSILCPGIITESMQEKIFNNDGNFFL